MLRTMVDGGQPRRTRPLDSGRKKHSANAAKSRPNEIVFLVGLAPRAYLNEQLVSFRTQLRKRGMSRDGLIARETSFVLGGNAEDFAPFRKENPNNGGAKR